VNGIRVLLGAIPPLLVGASVAGAAEMSAGLLLYSTDGFLPALTLILTVETGALALGLWSGTLQLGEGVVEQVRRRWLFALLSFARAAGVSAGMTLVEELLTGGIGQGLGLAFLGSLPLFALGSLLGAMARPGGAEMLPAASVGVPSVAGLALGFLLTGGILLPNMAPYTLYLVCLTALSGGALLQGWVLDGRPSKQLLELRWTARGEVRAEEWIPSSGGLARRILLEDGRVRGAEDLEGLPGREWERAVLTALTRDHLNPGSVLYLGGGSGTIARILFREFPQIRVVVVEGSGDLLILAREHLHPFPEWRKVRVLVGDPWISIEGLEGLFPLILVDSGFLPALAGLPSVPQGGFEALAGLAGPAGSVVLGGIGSEISPDGVPLDAFMQRASAAFSSVTYYQGEEEGFILLSGSETLPWSPAPPGFQVTGMKEA
jgi:spermidine synthase